MARFCTNMRRKAWLFFLALPLVLIGCGRQNDDNLYNVQGSWFIYHTANDKKGLQPVPVTFAFSQTRQDITGSAWNGNAISGSTSDVSISFSYIVTGNTGNVSALYSGTIFVIGTMSGTWTTTDGHSGTWQAIVDSAPLVTVTGRWKINYATNGVPGATGSNTFEFKQNNISLAESTFGEIPVTGSVTAVTILFTWVQGDTTYFYTGTVSGGNSMTGTWLTDKGQSGTWSGTLQPEPAS